jgi:hypothetical protein
MTQTDAPKNWRELYDAALTLEQMKPWLYFQKTQLIAVQLPDREEPVFCSILGEDKKEPGFSLYSGWDSLFDIGRLTEPELSGAYTQYLLFDHNSLTCRRQNRSALSREHWQYLCELGLETEEQDSSLTFFSYQKAYMPCRPDDSEVAWMIPVCRGVISAIQTFLRRKIPVDWDGGQVLWHGYHTLRGQWDTFASVVPDPHRPYPAMRLENDLLRKRLQKAPCNGRVLLIDFFYLGTPIHAKEFPRPINPHLLLVFDNALNSLIYRAMLLPSETESAALANFFVKYVMAKGRMAQIRARNPLVFSALSDTCQYCGVEMCADPLPFLDQIAEKLTGSRQEFEENPDE